MEPEDNDHNIPYGAAVGHKEMEQDAFAAADNLHALRTGQVAADIGLGSAVVAVARAVVEDTFEKGVAADEPCIAVAAADTWHLDRSNLAAVDNSTAAEYLSLQAQELQLHQEPSYKERYWKAACWIGCAAWNSSTF